MSMEEIGPGLYRRVIDEGAGFMHDRIGTKSFVEFAGSFAEYVVMTLSPNTWDDQGDYFDRSSL